MPCRDCQNHLPSDEALKPRGGLSGYGYCKAAPTLLLRARLFPDHGDCWLVPIRYQERRP